MTLKKRIARLTYPYRRKREPAAGQKDAREMHRRAAETHGLLQPIFDNTPKIKPNDRILLTMGRDESSRISYFLKYYRNLGIDHFLFVDNASVSPMADQLSDQSDVSLWYTDDSYVRSKYGVDWMNALLGRYAVGHWALTVDLDEFFVFPLMEIRSFTEFLEYMDDSNDPSLYSPLIDMYPNGPIASATVPEGESPLSYADHFDSTGYFPVVGGYEDTWLRGGPRCRVFADGVIDDSPTINKTPLIKWQKSYAYLASTHSATPFRLNHIHKNHFLGPTGALLHFKFISSFKEKAEFAVVNKNHYQGSSEYKKYLRRLDENEKINLMCPMSVRYESTKTLIDRKLMSLGLWE
ncbi:MAG: glycosyltransferase family 2 protein [Akkermansiaceae bacterium]